MQVRLAFQNAVRVLALSVAMISQIAVAAPPTKALPENKCFRLLHLSGDELAGVRKDFVHNTNFTYEVKTTHIRNQCSYGSCWIHGTLADLEQKILSKTGKKVDLSEQYLIVQSLRLRAIDALTVAGAQVSEGGSMYEADWLIQHFGILPASAWKPRIPFEQSPHSGRMMYFLNNRLSKFHLDTSGLVDAIKKAELLAEAKQDVLDILETYSGPLPETFQFEGKTFTAQSWAKEHLPSDGRTIVRLKPQRPKLPEELNETAHQMTPKELDVKETIAPVETDAVAEMAILEEQIIGTLQNGEGVPMAFDVVFPFIDDHSGIMSIAAFHAPDGFAPVPASMLTTIGPKSAGGHQVEIIAVDVDKEGHIIKLKIKNSWSTNSGDHGFYYMYRDYFEAFVRGIYVQKWLK